MNEEIQSLSNKIVYNNSLQCSSNFVKNRRLNIDLNRM